MLGDTYVTEGGAQMAPALETVANTADARFTRPC
jgi:hypothetical protein